MEEENKKKIQEQESIIKADLERLELLQRAHEKKGKQLTIDGEVGSLKEIDELRELVGKQLENPAEKYNVYYKGIQKLLIDHLPKGEEAKEMRDIIYDEKNIFLNLGKRKSDGKGTRGSDGRMTFQPIMNEILDIVISWVGSSQNPFDIYRDFYMLNEKHGYLHEEYDDSTKGVAKAMLTLAEDK
ncbi:hypothetical protein [Sphingobacterium sp. IITKGP-BTPF85]|uniref:hypothetical protein n=1 Tax=Sphingobacterium sp. IITKGP-BTPF85 TaxID=1338009 RepID=UPI00038A0CF0|nr:hypothetical protein [Sphingobacterium sp. IITKGP-BTPF85]KKX48750.1 hypothetical protein L950_0219420 [Sphingobacterium sp. IITKGP-BTPF85]